VGTSKKPIIIAYNYATVLELAISFKETVMPKKCMYINCIIEGLHHPSFKSLVSAKKISSLQWPIVQYEF
jgi:hypothetical protein